MQYHPNYFVAGITGYATPEYALRPPIAFSEWVDIIELVIVFAALIPEILLLTLHQADCVAHQCCRRNTDRRNSLTMFRSVLVFFMLWLTLADELRTASMDFADHRIGAIKQLLATV